MPDDPEFAEYSSPPCFLHELTADYRVAEKPAPEWADVACWRKAERKRLLDERLDLTVDERQARSARIVANLDRVVPSLAGRILGIYWPFRGEPDLRNWAIRAMEAGARIALPVVVEKHKPLEYRLWSPGDPLERGVWDILVPVEGAVVHPHVVIAPVVGYDGGNYRLGYGGGFFDRTLAVLPGKPLKIGVGYAQSKLPTIYPQPHDIAMDMIVTDD